MNFEAVIGLEIHVQLNTRTKTFCACSTEYGSRPNAHTCPVCLGLPGALPVLNGEALRKGVMAGLALNCRINAFSVFARKNYFYPDLPKAYQISQYEEPLNTGGHVTILDENGAEKRIGITRAHLEEDAGKLIHDEDPKGPSYVDFNRCGVPLLEIVSEPDIRTPEEAYRFLTAVREIMQYTGVSDCNMEKGELRVDVNVSLREAGEKGFGVKQEIKNMNSFAGVKRALEYEIRRQAKTLRSGARLTLETRLFDQNKGATVPMRSKEEAHDYRYFPDPDLVPMAMEPGFIDSLRRELPELPEVKRKRFEARYGLTAYDASILCSSPKIAKYFEEAVETPASSGGEGSGGSGEEAPAGKSSTLPKKIANWVQSELMAALNARRTEIDRFPVTPAMLRELFELIESGRISGKMAKDVFDEMVDTGKTAGSIAELGGLQQVTDRTAIGEVVDEIIRENEKVAQEFRNGKRAALGFLVGQVMKKTEGKANPKLVNELLKEKLEGGRGS
jgi:aspartyl-tRNA(Asn)/glutamyl-tRNA(Gln) amidotransferase subunit B